MNKAYEDPDTRGVCLYVKSIHNATEIHSKYTDQFKDCVWISIKDKNYKNLDPVLHNMIKQMSTDDSFHEIVITGDFNHKDIKWSDENSNITTNNPTDANFVECIDDSYLHQLVDDNTRYPHHNNQAPSLLDLVLTKDVNLISDIQYNSHIGESDHITLNFNIHTSLEPETSSSNNNHRYKYYKADIDKMNDMFNINWEDALNGLSVEESYTKFLNNYKDAVQKCVPCYKDQQSNVLPNKPIWMKSSTEKLVKAKQHAWVKFLNTKHPDHYELYKTARNRVTHAVTDDRKEYEKGIAKEIKNNIKAFWKYVNRNRKNKCRIPNLIKKNGQFTTSDEEKANALNNQFCSVFTHEDVNNIPEFPERAIHSYLTRIYISKEKVLKKLQNLNADKSSGPDEVHPFILKNCAKKLVDPLTIIFAKSLTNGILPSIWKHGQITPLFKKGKRNQPVNYRPVALTSVVGKILESLIADDIVDHIATNNLNNKNQHGFTKFKSTVTNLLQALNIWTDALSHGFPVDVIYFDYEKAFDKVPHQRLLHQLRSLGIVSEPLAWISDFLNSRTQAVSVNGKSSAVSDVSSGVPQGSVLGPILFLLYVCDAPHMVKNFLALFADDTKLYSILLDMDLSPEDLQEDVNNLSRWSERMLMSYNISKCHTLHLGSKNPHNTYILSKCDIINEETSKAEIHKLQSVNFEKDLGVIIDTKLSFNQHIDNKLLKAKQMLGIVRSTFKFINEDIFLRLYKSIIRPHLEYADIVWAPTTKEYQDKLEKFQRRATRIVPSISHLSYSERLRKLNLPTLRYRRLRSSMLFLYKHTHNLINADFNTHCNICQNSNALQPSLSNSTRGNSLKFQIQHNPGIRQKFFTSHALPFWNRLKENTVTASSLNVFKNRLSTDAAMPSQFDYCFSY